MTSSPDRPRDIDPTLAPSDPMAALRAGLARAFAALAHPADDVELTAVARRYVASARKAHVPLETAVATFREVFLAHFHTGDRVTTRLRCERFVTYLLAAYRWPD